VATILMIFPLVTERHYQVVERQLQVVERRSVPARSGYDASYTWPSC